MFLGLIQFPANAQDSTEIESLISIPPKTDGPVEVIFNLLDLELLNIEENNRLSIRRTKYYFRRF
jgi:hypothetical protein